MDFARPFLEFAGLIIGLSLVGLVLARSRETAVVLESSATAFSRLISAASMGASGPVESGRRYGR